MSGRPCYYVREKGTRVLIPNCMAAMHSNDLRDCTCDRTKHRASLEDRVERLEHMVRALQRERIRQ